MDFMLIPILFWSAVLILFLIFCAVNSKSHICKKCGHYSGIFNHGNFTQNIICKCDAYRLACTRPIRMEEYIDNYGEKRSKWIFAQDIYDEEYFQKEAERMFNNRIK